MSHARPVYDPTAITHRRTRDDEERTEESGEQEGVRSGEDEGVSGAPQYKER